MQVAWLPQHVCNLIDQVSHSFIRKGNNNKGLHLVGWNKITQKKKDGGLGIRKGREANTSLLGKTRVEHAHDKDKLWVQIVSHKYVQNEVFVYGDQMKGSRVWNSILKAKSVQCSKMGIVCALAMVTPCSGIILGPLGPLLHLLFKQWEQQ